MKFLLDTNAFLRWTFDERLPKGVRRILGAGRYKLYISIVTAWEIGVKVSQSRVKNLPTHEVQNGADRLGAEILPVMFEHIEVLYSLPYHHRDPFDRMLIAQAISEDAVLLSSDERFPLYKPAGLKVQWD